MSKKILEVWREGDILLVKSKLNWLVDIENEVEEEEDLLTDADIHDIIAHVLLYADSMEVPDNGIGWIIKFQHLGGGVGDVIQIEPLSAEVLATIDPTPKPGETNG